MSKQPFDTRKGKACHCAVKDRYFWKITGRGTLKGKTAYFVECSECGAQWLTNAKYCMNLAVKGNISVNRSR